MVTKATCSVLDLDPIQSLNMNGNRIEGLGTPVLQTDASNKDYVDLNALPIIGGTMAGALDMGGFGINNLLNPTSAQDAATKNYVDTAAATPLGYISSLQMSNGTDAQHDIDITAGQCRDTGDTTTINLISGITKRIDGPWTEGTGQGGFPSALPPLMSNTWYHFFVIAKPDGTVDVGWDTSLTATNLLNDATGYTAFRRIGSTFTDGSSNIVAFIQFGDLFTWDISVQEFASQNTSGILVTVQTPLGVKTLARFGCRINEFGFDATEAFALITSPQQTNSVPSISNCDASSLQFFTAWRTDSNGYKEVVTNESSQVRFRTNASDCTFRAYLHGYVDRRGQDD